MTVSQSCDISTNENPVDDADYQKTTDTDSCYSSNTSTSEKTENEAIINWTPITDSHTVSFQEYTSSEQFVRPDIST